MAAEPEPALGSPKRSTGFGDRALCEAVEALDLAVHVLDRAGVIIWCSPGFCKLTGYSVQDVLGRPRTELITGPFLRTEGFHELEKNLRGAQRFLTEFVTRSASGMPYWTLLEATPRTRNGVLNGMTVFERDITERRKVEEHGRQALARAHSLAMALRQEKHLLTAVLASIPHMVWWKDLQRRYSGANAAYLALRGLDSEAAVIGRLEEQLDVSDSLGPHLTGLEGSVLDRHQEIHEATLTHQFTDADGVPSRTLLISVLPHRGCAGELLGTIGVGVDISGRLELERQLAQASRLESLGQLSAGIAHELNTPVQYVRDNTQFVHESCTQVINVLRHLEDFVGRNRDAGPHPASLPTADPGTAAPDAIGFVRNELTGLDITFLGQEIPSALEQSLEGLERVTEIVRAMRDFSHPGSGRNPTDLNKLVETTAQVSRGEWRHVADLELDLDPALGRVPCWEGDIKQALLNIVVNAAHAVQERLEGHGKDPDHGKILLRTRRAGEYAEITVTDNGTGMTPAVQEKIFDPFFTTKAVGRGTGQGLNLAHRSIVGKHSGRLEVRSTPGDGSTFTILLPLRASVNSDAVSPSITERIL